MFSSSLYNFFCCSFLRLFCCLPLSMYYLKNTDIKIAGNFSLMLMLMLNAALGVSGIVFCCLLMHGLRREKSQFLLPAIAFIPISMVVSFLDNIFLINIFTVGSYESYANDPNIDIVVTSSCIIIELICSLVMLQFFNKAKVFLQKE